MRQFVIINDHMYLKRDGVIVDAPDPLPEEFQVEIDSLWAEYDKRGQPFTLYGPEKP